MRRLRPMLLAMLALTAACAGTSPPGDPAACLALFRQYDRIERHYQTTRFDAASDSFILNPQLSRQIQWLRNGRCITMTRDLDGMEALAQRLAPYRPATGGAAIPPTAVHVGVVTSITDEARATVFFRGLGYGSRGIGAQELGRRLYIGPFHDQATLDEAMSIARQAGFISPYVPSRANFRF